MGVVVEHPKRTKLWFAAGKEPMLVVFEPMGDEFPISPGHDIYVDVPTEDMALIEISVWNTGISVTLPFPGDNKVLDHDGSLIEHLWH